MISQSIWGLWSILPAHLGQDLLRIQLAPHRYRLARLCPAVPVVCLYARGSLVVLHDVRNDDVRRQPVSVPVRRHCPCSVLGIGTSYASASVAQQV